MTKTPVTPSRQRFAKLLPLRAPPESRATLRLAPTGRVQRDAKRAARQPRSQPLRPFDQTDSIDERILDAKIKRLFRHLEPVKIKCMTSGPSSAHMSTR